MNPSFLVDGLPIWVIDNFLLPYEHEQMHVYCAKSLYSSEHTSSPHQELFSPRLVSNLTTDQVNSLPLTKAFNDTLKELNIKTEIECVYINLCTKDTVCVEHVDASFPGITMLYYPNTQWDLSWGGETLFINAQKEIQVASIFKPNRAIFFDPRILHTGRAPTSAAKAYRYNIAYKTKDLE